MKLCIVALCLGITLVATELRLSAQQPSVADTVRFLEQSTFGPSAGLVASVRAQGFDAFFAAQLNAPMTPYPDLDVMPTVRPTSCVGTCRRDNYTMYPLQVHFFWNAVHGQDQLRQRVAWALSQILVVSGVDIPLSSWMRPYQQLLYASAFGNYRQLLYNVTRNAAMGRYLDTVNNQCQARTPPDATACQDGSATKPNENYARELLQLFAIGTDLLNIDGTPVLDADGAVVPTYDQHTIEELSRVLTGWVLAQRFDVGIPNYVDPMRATPASERRHDRGPKVLRLQCGPTGGVTSCDASLPGGQSADEELQSAIAHFMAHQNVAPFISRQLIQHLVTSNPSPGFVADIAGVFVATTKSPQQLYEVVRAILLHPEARWGVLKYVMTGKLREPVLFITNILRALNASTDGVLNSIITIDGSPIGSAQLSQSVFAAPSVFSFYAPNHVIPRTDPPLFGPQFQIHSTATAVRRANFVNQVVFDAIPGTSVNLSPWLKVASIPDALVSSLDALFLHGTMSGEMRKLILEAVTAVPQSDLKTRVQQAVYLIATSNQYQVQR